MPLLFVPLGSRGSGVYPPFLLALPPSKSDRKVSSAVQLPWSSAELRAKLLEPIISPCSSLSKQGMAGVGEETSSGGFRCDTRNLSRESSHDRSDGTFSVEGTSISSDNSGNL